MRLEKKLVFALGLMLSVVLGHVSRADDADSGEKITAMERPNALSLELMGRAFIYSVDYDRAISRYVVLGGGLSYWDTTVWWHGPVTGILVVPLYGNFYFSPDASRVFLTAGADLVKADHTVGGGNNFKSSGVIAVLGGGYELRDPRGWLFRAASYGYFGRSINVALGLSGGWAF